MKKVKARLEQKPAVLFLLISVVFAGALVLIFGLQKKQLDAQIDALVASNLRTHTHNQAAEMNAAITDVRTTMEAAAAMIQTIRLSINGPWFNNFLKELNTVSAAYAIDYISMEDLYAGIDGGSTQSSDRDTYERLKNGETVVTQMRYSSRLEGYYFAVAAPVEQNGQVMGALRARMNADVLLGSFTENAIYKGLRTCVVTKGGDFTFTVTLEANEANLLDVLLGEGISAENVDGISKSISGSGTQNYQFKRHGQTYFVSVDDIGYNGWRLVAFVRGPDVLVRSDTMFLSSVAASVALILLTTAAGCLVYAMLLSNRKKLEREQRRYALLGEFSDTILFEYSQETDAVEITSNALGRLNVQDTILPNISAPKRVLGLLHPDERDKLREIFHEEKEEGKTYYTELRLKSKEGDYLWCGCQYRASGDAKKGNRFVMGKLVDITDQRSREQKLKEWASRDILTGTYNKAGAEMIAAHLNKKPQGVLLMLDIDRFKRINDTYGHSQGDAVLAQVGSLLNELFRQDDVVARVGGDEFIVFLPGVCGPDMAGKRVEKLLSRIRQISVGRDGAELSASVGLACAPQDGETFEALYAEADRAMYAAKQAAQESCPDGGSYQ